MAEEKKKAKGVLPSNTWLIKNGYKGLVKCMRKHPDMFAHIDQENSPTDKDFKKVDKHTRAGKSGKLIMCPHCKNIERVYHFAWYATTCPKCKKDIDKYDYFVFHKFKEKQTKS